MATIDDDEPDYDQLPDGPSPDDDNDNDDDDNDDNDSAAAFEAELARQVAQMPPQLYEAMKPLLLLASVANYMLLGYPDDPVPAALKELLDYDTDAMQTVANVQDTPGLARVMAAHTLQLFDFVLIGRLVFESGLEPALHAYLTRHTPTDEDYTGPREYLLTFSETLLENIGQYLTGGDEDLREDLRMRRLQTESIFARLDDTLRPFYPPGHSPADDEARALDEADEAEDQEEAAVHVSFNQAQRVTLGTALHLPSILVELGETPFARALAGVGRLRKKALGRLAARLAAGTDDEPFSLTWSELLRLYQAAQVCALSAVTDVLAVGSLEDMMRRTAEDDPETPEEAAEYARHARELMTMMMAGFVEVVEENHPDDEDVAEAKAEISRLAELLLD